MTVDDLFTIFKNIYEYGGGPTYTARVYYRCTDKRFKAWGKYSQVLVPRLARKIVGRVLVPLTIWDAYKCYKKCYAQVGGQDTGG
jgi:hypothetical protein